MYLYVFLAEHLLFKCLIICNNLFWFVSFWVIAGVIKRGIKSKSHRKLSDQDAVQHRKFFKKALLGHAWFCKLLKSVAPKVPEKAFTESDLGQRGNPDLSTFT